MFLIYESLIDLQGLHLSHRLRVALLLAGLLRSLLLAHCRDLRLQIRTVAVHLVLCLAAALFDICLGLLECLNLPCRFLRPQPLKFYSLIL